MYVVYLVKRSKKICSDAAYLEDKRHYCAWDLVSVKLKKLEVVVDHLCVWRLDQVHVLNNLFFFQIQIFFQLFHKVFSRIFIIHSLLKFE